MNEQQQDIESKTESQLKAARSAINYALNRIREDENLSCHMGNFTEAFARLTQAAALLNDAPVEEVRKYFSECVSDRKSNYEKVEEIGDIVNNYDIPDKDELIRQLREIISQ